MSSGAEPRAALRLCLAGLALLLAGCAAKAPVATGPGVARLAPAGDAAAVERLQAATGAADSVVRARAQAARVQLGEGPEGVGLDDESAWVRRAAAEALAPRLPDRAVRDALVQAAGDAGLDPTTRCLILAPVVADEPGLVALVAPWIAGPRPSQACLVVAAVAGSDAAAAALDAGLRTGGLKLDLAALHLLAGAPLDGIGDALAAGLGRVEPVALPSAGAILLAHDHPEGRRVLRGLLTTGTPGEEEEAAMEAIDWLLARPSAEGAELLDAAADGPSPRVAAYAGLAALAYGRADGAAVRAVLRDSEPEQARQALAAARTGVLRFPDQAPVQRAARKLARGLLGSDDPRTRVAVAELVAVLPDEELRTALVPWLADEDDRVAVAAAAALALQPAP